MELKPGVFPICADDYPRALEVWEASVRATHDFVREEDIQVFKPLVQSAFPNLRQMACVRDEQGQLAGFIAVVDRKVEMLFLHPDARGQGAGRRLLSYALDEFAARSLDVNEQNEQAAAFYRHMGFQVVGRSDVDAAGKPYPLLHMRLAAPQADLPDDRLVVLNDPDLLDVQFLEDRLYEYNVESTGISDGQQFAFFLRDGDGAIIAGIYGWVWGETSEIRDLWVHKQWRKHGLGSRLLQAAIDLARERGAAQIFLSTHSFQAPDFYRRFGFESIGQIEDHPRGHQLIFLRKRL